jgi:hypothetical protein
MFVTPRDDFGRIPDWLKKVDLTESVVKGAKGGALSSAVSFDAEK